MKCGSEINARPMINPPCAPPSSKPSSAGSIRDLPARSYCRPAALTPAKSQKCSARSNAPAPREVADGAAFRPTKPQRKPVD